MDDDFNSDIVFGNVGVKTEFRDQKPTRPRIESMMDESPEENRISVKVCIHASVGDIHVIAKVGNFSNANFPEAEIRFSKKPGPEQDILKKREF